MTDHPTSARVVQQIVKAFADGETPRYLIRDRDGVYRLEVSRRLESLQIENQDVLIVDDIFDTGFTMKGVIDSFHQMNPKSLKSLVLLVKKV